MAQFLNSPVFQIVGPNGTPYPGAKLYIYETGTTTLLSLYSDEALTTAASNPLVADASGLFSTAFFAETKFKAVLKTSGDVTIATVDPAYSIGASDATSAANVSFDGSDIGFSAATVQEAIEEADQTYAALSGAAFTGDVTVTQAGGGTFLTLESTDAGSASGPDLELYRNSASPAASDILGLYRFCGNDSAGNKEVYADIEVAISDPTSGSEDVVLSIRRVLAGTFGNAVHIGAGLYMSGATGSDKGAGTINGTLYDEGVAVSSMTAKAWVNFNGTGTVAIRDSFNVSSITDNGTGDYTVNFTTAMDSANYAAIASGCEAAAGSVPGFFPQPHSFTTTSVRIKCPAAGSTSTTLADWEVVTLVIFG